MGLVLSFCFFRKKSKNNVGCGNRTENTGLTDGEPRRAWWEGAGEKRVRSLASHIESWSSDLVMVFY
jgi:hypothetical protein